MTNQELEKIYNEAYRSVYWTAMSLLKNEDDAEDIVQETFISLIRSYDTIKDKSKVHAWLKKTAANKCLDRIKLTKTVNVEDEFFDSAEDVPEDFLPDSLVESAETRKIIMDIIENSLSEDVRRTIILFYFNELSVKEISEALGVPQGTILWRLSSARKRIKKEVEKYEKDNDTKLFAMGTPFLTKLFMKEAEQLPIKPMSASLTLMTASADSSAASAAEAGTEIASQTAAQTGAAIAAETAADTGMKVASVAAKKGMSAMTKKIIISSIAVLLTGAAVTGAIMLAKPKEEEKKKTKKKSQTKITTVSEEDSSVEIDPAVAPNVDESKGISTVSDTVDPIVTASSSKETEVTDTYGQIYSTPTGERYEYVVFGHYEQDVHDENGPEPIEWFILDEQDGKLLLVSRYILDGKKYNEEETAVSWENCTLRAWLNSDFLNAAFSAEEQAAISDTTVINGVDSYTGKDFGNDTVDKVFLLSVEECMKYFRGDSNIDSYFYFAILNDISECKGPTRYAATNDVGSGWWGRSSEPDSTKAIYVNSYDALDLNISVTEEKNGVRPAIWVDKEAVSYTIDDGKVHVDVNDLDLQIDPDLVGTWIQETDTKTLYYIFNSDNTCTAIKIKNGVTKEDSGVYTVDGPWMLIVLEKEEATYCYYTIEEGELILENEYRTQVKRLQRKS